MENALLYTEQKWKQLTAFSNKEEIKNKLWAEIVDHYNEPYRFYHNLHHIDTLFKLSEQHLSQIQNPFIVGFSIIYHDIIYDTFKDNNEEESVAKARQHLTQINVKEAVILAVEQFILATKTHSIIEDFAYNNDLSLFLDFDLAILGAGWDDYELYSKQIRKEYRQYPENVYNPGRKYALENLDKKTNLYYSAQLQQELEPEARKNIFREIQILS